MEIKLWRLESLQIQNRSCKNYYWKTIFMSTIVESKNRTTFELFFKAMLPVLRMSEFRLR